MRQGERSEGILRERGARDSDPLSLELRSVGDSERFVI